MIIKPLLSLLVSSSFAFDPSVIMMSQSAQAAKSEKVAEWKPIVVKKGFVLSTDLYDNRECLKIWNKQIPSFKEQNPQVKDVDKFYPGDKIKIQVCEPSETLVASTAAPVVKKKKSKKKKKVEVVEAAVAEPVYQTKEQDNSGPKEAWDDSDGQLFLGLGFLSESHNELTDSTGSMTFRVRSGFHQSLNHRLMIDASPSVIYVRNKIDFKTAPSKYQFFLSVGMGNRIGLVKRAADLKMSDNITTYAESSLGFNLRYSEKINITMETGVTFNSKYPMNFSVMATKKLGDSPYYLGGYFDYVWTDSSLLDQDRNDRRLLTGGIIFSY